MSVKTKIKNDLWHINYVIPFTAKYLQGGKLHYIKKALPEIAHLHVIKGSGKRDISTDIEALFERVELQWDKNSSFFYWIDTNKTIAVRGNILSNFTLDYDRIISTPFHEHADRAIKAGGVYGERAQHMKNAVERLKDRVLRVLEVEDSAKARVLQEEFSALLDRPARHFHEGLQRILFFNQMLWQTRHTLNGLGRLDKILGGLYAADLRDGVITRDDAHAMISDFLTCLSKWYSYKSSALLGDIGQIIVLGGNERDGSYFCNDLTYLFMQVQAELERPDPKILLRVSSRMPEELLSAAVDALAKRTGSPLLSNDDVIIPYLTDFGIAEGDAHSYCVSACWEPFIPGKSLDQNNIKTFDFFRPLDAMLRAGDLDTIKGYDDLLAQYDAYLRQEWKAFLHSLDEFVWAVDPLVSILTTGCTKNGKDISEGGAVYNNYGVTSVGMGSACDTLLNIDRLVFQEKTYTLTELNGAREKNYSEHPELLAMLKNQEKHFAHDDERAAALADHIMEVSNQEIEKYRNPLGGRAKFGLSSPNYIKNAKKMPADLAGRVNGTPYGTHISCVDAPYTEVVQFAGNLHHGKYGFNGNVVDFFVSPGLLENNQEQFASFLRAAISVGFFQMQMNILDSATLIDAKRHPEKYPGLIVRVWGFSAYFNDLPEDYQNLLIERAQANETAGH